MLCNQVSISIVEIEAWLLQFLRQSSTLLFDLPSDLLSVSAVVKELSVVQKKWRTIGEELGVQKYLLDDIRTDYSDHGSRLREVLHERMGSQTTTWGDIIAVLRTPRVGQSQLADHLEAKYCPSELANLHCSISKGCLPTHCVCKWIVLLTKL